MVFSVVICTWNRSHLLAQTLQRLTSLGSVGAPWEIVVVANACTDNTIEVASSFVGRLPVRVVAEPEPGHSNARNRGVREALGQFVVWTDDDVLVSERWLQAYAGAIAAHPQADFFGGPIRPWFERTPPAWLSDNWERLSSVFATRDFGGTEFPLDSQRIPFGANFVVRRDVQVRFPYDPAFGRRKGDLLSNDESAVMQAMLEAGHAGWWVPDAAVEHFIPAGRLTTKYVRGFYVAKGVVDSVSFDGGGGATLLGRPRWLWKRAVGAEFKYRWSRLARPSSAWVPRLVEAAQAWGHAGGRRWYGR